MQCEIMGLGGSGRQGNTGFKIRGPGFLSWLEQLGEAQNSELQFQNVIIKPLSL